MYRRSEGFKLFVLLIISFTNVLCFRNYCRSIELIFCMDDVQNRSFNMYDFNHCYEIPNKIAMAKNWMELHLHAWELSGWDRGGLKCGPFLFLGK